MKIESIGITPNSASIGLFSTEGTNDDLKFELSVLEQENSSSFTVKSLITYVGTNDNIDIWHTSSIGTVFIKNTDGEYLWDSPTDDVLLKSNLEKNTPFEIDTFNTGKRVSELPNGDYVAELSLKIAFSEDDMMKTYKMSVSFSINK